MRSTSSWRHWGADFTGGLLLHPAAAGCVLNDLYREAAERGGKGRPSAGSPAPPAAQSSRRNLLDRRPGRPARWPW